jgi:hypothetical protein
MSHEEIINTPDGHALGNWVRTQRKQKDNLSAGRKLNLERLRDWTWDAVGALWELGYRYLTVYVAEFGDARVPNGHTTRDGYGLGRWVGVQRSNTDTMLDERSKRLEMLPGWSWAAQPDKWNDKYMRLLHV